VNSNKDYIACQSPLRSTCEDFWDMIIQYRITKIVMLNKFQQENNCYQYIPINKGQSLHFDRIEIKVTNIEYYLDNKLEIRHLIVKEVNIFCKKFLCNSKRIV
jgi:protein tyrosine phosphatase